MIAHRSTAMFTGQSAKHWVPPVQLAVVHASPASHCWLPHSGPIGLEGMMGRGGGVQMGKGKGDRAGLAADVMSSTADDPHISVMGSAREGSPRSQAQAQTRASMCAYEHYKC